MAHINYAYGTQGYGEGPYGGTFTIVNFIILNSIYQSIILQELLNYFDENDSRIRENITSLGAQLLNSVAYQIEGLQKKIDREMGALNMSTVPLNIDNGGVYYAGKIPLNFSLPIDTLGVLKPPTVTGVLGTGSLTLVPYDDTLPVPVRVEQDLSIPTVHMPNPLLCDLTDPGVSAEINPGILPIPNNLIFLIENLGTTVNSLNIQVNGQLDPPVTWYQDVVTRTESLRVPDDGFYKTTSVWSSVDSILITNIPPNCRIRCWFLGVNLPAVPDTERPYTHFAYRDIVFPRYWQLDGALLNEVYKRNRFSGYEVANPFSLINPMLDVAVEPNTGGLFMADATKLYYVDRRTPLSDKLTETGLTQEPLYGLNAYYDFTNPGITRWIAVQPVAFAKSNQCVQYRYSVTDPNGNLYILNPDGSLMKYQGNVGWRSGQPTPISFPAVLDGTYSIQLETTDEHNNRTFDIYPYLNMAMDALSTTDVSGLIAQIAGIAFDGYGRLWIWTGQFAMRMILHYDAYLWDPNSRTIYMTDQYDEVLIS